ncbi:MAG: ferredoxin-thioredoxin reductase catalytic domain-containing protein [Dehalococcoidales bacterium]|jgi:ferredoxin-thioredoxin reductase catalytic subunit
MMENELENLRNRVISFCDIRGYALSPEAEKILVDIVRLKETAGDYYCPCRDQRNPDTVCVCKPVRNGLVDVMGTCFCNLIVSKKS